MSSDRVSPENLARVAKKQDDRPQSMSAVIDELESVLDPDSQFEATVKIVPPSDSNLRDFLDSVSQPRSGVREKVEALADDTTKNHKQETDVDVIRRRAPR